jgi:hypothetical protein
MPEDEQPSPVVNPYAAPQADAVLPDELDVQPVSLREGDLRAFVGRKAEYYLRKWSPRLFTTKGSTGFNWAAFFLSAFWFPYRKMFQATFIFYGILIVISVAEDVLFLGLLQLDDIPRRWSTLTNITIAIACGMLGNRVYLYHAMRVIGDVRAIEPRDEVARETIARRGGTSLLASFGYFLLFIVTALGVVILTEILIFGF